MVNCTVGVSSYDTEVGGGEIESIGDSMMTSCRGFDADELRESDELGKFNGGVER